MSDANPSYQQTFFIVPQRILKLEGLTIQLLKFYETVFQFWNHGKSCYLTNDVIKERTGIKSDSTISKAFNFFEKAGEMRRVIKDEKRFIVQVLSIECQPIPEEEQNLSTTPSLQRDPPSRQRETPPLASARHNNNNINIKNINKSSATRFERAKTKQQDVKTFADVTKQSNSFGAQGESPEESQRQWEERMRYYGKEPRTGNSQEARIICPDKAAG